jgi:hypothetical protein
MILCFRSSSLSFNLNNLPVMDVVEIPEVLLKTLNLPTFYNSSQMFIPSAEKQGSSPCK